jgi:hypothetical protein
MPPTGVTAALFALPRHDRIEVDCSISPQSDFT